MVGGGRCVRKRGEACGGKVKSRTMSGWHVRLCVGRGAFVGNVRVGRSGVLSADSDFLALDGVGARRWAVEVGDGGIGGYWHARDVVSGDGLAWGEEVG